jgi:hypothetical protein
MNMTNTVNQPPPDTAGELTTLAAWIDESAAARIRDITLQMMGAAELAARKTAAAAAVLADFHRESDAYLDAGGSVPDWSSYAFRLASELGSVLDQLAAGPEPAATLTPQQREVIGQALADAADYREARGSDSFCADCEAHPAGICPDHTAELDRCDAYLELGRQLGVDVER